MIINLLINVVVLLIGAIFSMPIFPTIVTLPSIAGYDIDAGLLIGVGQFKTYITAFWWEAIVFQGFMFLLAYAGVKLVLKLFLGHRAPGS